MKAFMKFFQSQLQKQLDVENYLDCKQHPTQLLRQLKSSSEQKKLIKYLQKNTKNSFKIIRTLSVANLILLYSRDHFTLIENHLKPKVGKDEWINTKFLNPYYKFIIRCCTSKDMYLQCRTNMIRKGEALEMLFYTINMLKLLFKVVQKMPLLGRYYLLKHKAVISTAVQIIALQAQKLYGAFKTCLTQILYQRNLYIRTPQDEKIMRGILIDELNCVNEEMKRLFLDKYFYPLGKGIGVKLFRPEEQSPQCEKTIHSIVTNHQETQRQKKKQHLIDNLFTSNGLVNWQFYQQTLLSCTPNNVTGAKDQSNFKQLDQLAISEQDEDQVEADDLPNNNSITYKQKQSDKSTNTGIVQLKNKEM